MGKVHLCTRSRFQFRQPGKLGTIIRRDGTEHLAEVISQFGLKLLKSIQHRISGFALEMQRIFMDSKNEAKKFTPKKYRTSNNADDTQ